MTKAATLLKKHELLESGNMYTVYKVELSGKLSHKEELNADELDHWMESVYGRFATVQVHATNKGKSKTIRYTDNGRKFVKVK